LPFNTTNRAERGRNAGGTVNPDYNDQEPLSGDALLNEFKARWRPLVFLLSGPSGVGKDSVAERLQRSPEDGGIEGIKVVVTATTRERRPGEEDLKHYEFLAKDEFVRRQEDGYFVENASVYGPGNYYGVPRHQITSAIQAGSQPLIKIDVQGAATLKQMIPQSVAIFLAPESLQALHDQLNRRNSENYDAVQRRLKTARHELERFPGFDYVVVNRIGKLDDTVQQLRAIITAERLRNAPCPPPRL
jgi:guanylate kinase